MRPAGRGARRAAAVRRGRDQQRAREPATNRCVYTASKLEAERNRMVLHDIDIVDTTRGITHIKADLAEATGEDLGNSDWVLTGHVQVSMPQGKLRADRATMQIRQQAHRIDERPGRAGANSNAPSIAARTTQRRAMA